MNDDGLKNTAQRDVCAQFDDLVLGKFGAWVVRVFDQAVQRNQQRLSAIRKCGRICLLLMRCVRRPGRSRPGL